MHGARAFCVHRQVLRPREPFLKSLPKKGGLLRNRRGRAFLYLTLLPGFDCAKQCPLLEGPLSEHRFDSSPWISSRVSKWLREARSTRTVEKDVNHSRPVTSLVQVSPPQAGYDRSALKRLLRSRPLAEIGRAHV